MTDLTMSQFASKDDLLAAQAARIAELESQVQRAAEIERAAILLRVGDLYENREAQTDRPLHGNQTFERLLNPYRVMEL